MEKKERVHLLDILRGGAIILVVMYHVLYDLKFIYGKNIPPLITPGQPAFEVLHVCFLWVLFAVSGICSEYSKNSLKRGAALYLLGFGITFVTAAFMPSELIVFGVISCFGACMAITYFLRPLLGKIPWAVRFILFTLLWAVFKDFPFGGTLNLFFTKIILPRPDTLYGCDYLYPLGIRGPHFYSSDYFPLIPNIFMFLAGHALYEPVSKKKLPGSLYRLRPGFLGFIGRHTLLIYIIHQPLLIVFFDLIFTH